MPTHTKIHARVAEFEQAIRAEIAACEARGQRYSPTPALPEESDTTASELRTNPGKRFTKRIELNEQRRLMRAERLEINTYHKNNAIDFERSYYAALGLA